MILKKGPVFTGPFLCPWMGGMSQGARDGRETRADEASAMLACTIINYGID